MILIRIKRKLKQNLLRIQIKNIKTLEPVDCALEAGLVFLIFVCSEHRRVRHSPNV